MMFRRRNLLIKVLLLVPTLWILVTYLFATNEPSSDKLIDKSPVVSKHKAERSLQQQQPVHQNAHIEQLEGSQPRSKEQEYQANQEEAVLLPPRERDGPGELGKPVKLSNLTAEQQKLVKLGWKNNAFNQYISDMISVHRSLPDPRDKE